MNKDKDGKFEGSLDKPPNLDGIFQVANISDKTDGGFPKSSILGSMVILSGVVQFEGHEALSGHVSNSHTIIKIKSKRWVSLFGPKTKGKISSPVRVSFNSH